eukprot:363174-Rhodomonas_salina.1
MSADEYSSFDDEFSQVADNEDDVVNEGEVSTGEVDASASGETVDVSDQSWGSRKAEDVQKRKSEEDILLSSTGEGFGVATSSVGSLEAHDEREAGGDLRAESGAESSGGNGEGAEEGRLKGGCEEPKAGDATAPFAIEIGTDDSPRSTRGDTTGGTNEQTSNLKPSNVNEVSEIGSDLEDPTCSTRQEEQEATQQTASEQNTSGLNEVSENKGDLNQDFPLTSPKQAAKGTKEGPTERRAREPIEVIPEESIHHAENKVPEFKRMAPERSHSFA